MPGSRLLESERVAIERGLDAGLTQAQIAVVLGRSPATVSREVRRGGGKRSARRGVALMGRPRRYRADRAQQFALVRGRRPKPCRVVGALAAVVTGLLEADWSPQQIAAMLPKLFPDDQAMWVSHETIYQSLFVQTRGELRRELAAHLRTGRTRRKPHGTVERRGKLKGMMPISQRPADAEDRAVHGHWEGDLILGAVGKGAIITLVERHSRFVLLAPLNTNHTATDTREQLTALISRLPLELRKSLTWDQGREMAQHAEFSIETGLPVFFCDPHSPWQRGSNENTNGLLRQYWPKGSDLRHVTQAECDAIALRLNTRPRQTLNWQTPAQALDRALLATAG
ncbi:IS30 family transposase [Aeromicrobium sp. CF3.5]|uniref:IS30 family transposase n=1 Tax=Aeromicrobium sp. CF3.5 TaxID=3373078 RepID=UPI003EE5D4CE